MLMSHLSSPSPRLRAVPVTPNMTLPEKLRRLSPASLRFLRLAAVSAVLVVILQTTVIVLGDWSAHALAYSRLLYAAFTIATALAAFGLALNAALQDSVFASMAVVILGVLNTVYGSLQVFDFIASGEAVSCCGVAVMWPAALMTFSNSPHKNNLVALKPLSPSPAAVTVVAIISLTVQVLATGSLAFVSFRLFVEFGRRNFDNLGDENIRGVINSYQMLIVTAVVASLLSW